MKIAAAIIIAAALASPAAAQQSSCRSTEGIEAFMEEQHGEFLVGYGVDVQNRVTSIFVNSETGVWTALVSHPNGQTCRVADGTGWRVQVLPPQL